MSMCAERERERGSGRGEGEYIRVGVPVLCDFTDEWLAMLKINCNATSVTHKRVSLSLYF